MADESDRLARLEVMVTHLTSQMDKVAAVVGMVTKLQSDHDHHKDSLSRAFMRREGLEGYAKILEDQDKQIRDDLQKQITEVGAKLNMYKWLGTGLGIGASAVWIVVAWVIKNDVVSLLSAIAKVGGK